MNKPKIDNTEKAKSKKNKDKLEIEIKGMQSFELDGTTYTPEDLAARADAYASAKKAVKTLEASIKESKTILDSLMYRHWCHETALNGSPPDMRQLIGSTARFNVSQYQTADVPSGKVEALEKIGIDIVAHANSSSYEVKMGNVPKPMVNPVLDALMNVLGEETFKKVVSQKHKVDESFFSNLKSIVEESLGEGEKLVEKLELVVRTVKPTIQHLNIETDLDPTAAFDFAYEYAHVDNPERQKK